MILNSKERNLLRKAAHHLKDEILIGKDGVSENLIHQTLEAFHTKELVKGKIQQNSLEEVRQAAETLAKRSQSEVVCTIGNKFILYKRNQDNPQLLP